MPTELEELVGFLSSPRPQIRQLALEHLVGYSVPPHSHIFTTPDLKPIKHLKVLVNDIPPRAKDALTILINLTDSAAVRAELADDAAFLELLLTKITDIKYPLADQAVMLLANLSKSVSVSKLITLERAVPEGVSSSKIAMDQLMDCFVKGADKSLNKEANFDYLSYVFADLSALEAGRKYFVNKQEYDQVIPIQKIIVFTEHKSNIRRRGIASTIKNCCFDVEAHSLLMDPEGINLLPYILLPIMGSEEYSDEDTEGMPEDLQLLPPDKERDSDQSIIVTHLESLMLLTAQREGREFLRASKVYPIIRETHVALASENDDIDVAVERLVQVLMRDEAPEGAEVEEEEQDDGVIEEIC